MADCACFSAVGDVQRLVTCNRDDRCFICAGDCLSVQAEVHIPFALPGFREFHGFRQIVLAGRGDFTELRDALPKLSIVPLLRAALLAADRMLMQHAIDKSDTVSPQRLIYIFTGIVTMKSI